jgi:hypothetical protein
VEPPPLTGNEREVITWLLDHHREVLRRKCAGISEADARRTLPPSELTLLGLLRHVVFVEQYWFGYIFLGVVVEPEGELPHSRGSEPWIFDDTDDPDPDFHFGADDTVVAALALFDEQVSRSRVVAAASDFSDVAQRSRHGSPVNLRWIMVHLLEEYARHCGHADLLREQIDGSTGD